MDMSVKLKDKKGKLKVFINSFFLKNNKKGKVYLSWLVKILILIGFLVLITIIYLTLSGKMSGLGEWFSQTRRGFDYG